MAYSNGESGPCPATHPTRLVTLFYEVSFSTPHVRHTTTLSGRGRAGHDPSYRPLIPPRRSQTEQMMYSVDDFKDVWAHAKNPRSPFVLANGDPTGYGCEWHMYNKALGMRLTLSLSPSLSLFLSLQTTETS
jgi:hypothetical protein